ncbi:bifunctional demethylmenaquinone methyltransferase/2-methoxy-6-polyprenyl-1,4-benzoquinol methylase UbiE [Desulfatitalea alkaliphila]|uniref:Demethylmenaquinone methyltransferase n=1 Tax=Desulfatitalea alkaliphila TaxID=2929485 RepID=A0AA41UK77_9BACT|nr:bifunctional demethylmenaquinone methyltransferase/2-methoxy-6-polyprenyl-1,4-benzoquinol methylase UbiE [Desulfatitalea alkaliphila]MCJ8501162.1 bifunctional demethylmenaquinone methyltransferase/2-methoxy-6-polyprenyl-1,4-benzoquinol methylase UbiE [Desulfatitalea alkaliphila]
MKSTELPFVREMFNHIAPQYDFLNRLLSLRRDVHWRRALVAALGLNKGAVVLDVACGTADVPLEVVRQVGDRVRVVGADFAPQMLRLGRPKIKRAGPKGDTIHLVAADAFALPFAAQRFDAVTMAFGIRNVQDKQTVLQRFHHLLKPGGRLAILELGMPSEGLLGSLFRNYFSRLLPLVGRLFSRHGFAYSYLPDSVAHFPPPAAFAALMRGAGFENVRYRPLTLGIAVLFVGVKSKS